MEFFFFVCTISEVAGWLVVVEREGQTTGYFPVSHVEKEKPLQMEINRENIVDR